MKFGNYEISGLWLGATIASTAIWIGGHLFPVFGEPTIAWDTVFVGATIVCLLATSYNLREVM